MTSRLVPDAVSDVSSVGRWFSDTNIPFDPNACHQHTIYYYKQYSSNSLLPSVLWRCWLGGMKDIRPVKNWLVGCWRGCRLEQGADLHMAQLMPLPLIVSCFSKIQIGFTFLVSAHLGSPGQRAVKRLCVCVCVSTVAIAVVLTSHL